MQLPFFKDHIPSHSTVETKDLLRISVTVLDSAVLYFSIVLNSKTSKI